jgi:stress-induced-phosphoprotein 1
LDGINKCLLGDEMKEKLARAKEDPELMAILNDPVIERLFSECSTNPAATATHLKNSGVAAAKVQKLVDCGVIMI